jgi:N-methylhydantoinase B/acetone carboxylase alpha subunit
MFTQTLICNDKVNDGAYFAVETNFPEGSVANLGQAEGSTGIAWAFLQPAFTGYPRTLSRALQSRGFIEEVIGAYSVSGNVVQGGGVDQYGNSSAIMNFEVAAQGMGAKYVLDGTDTCAAMFNPEGDAGDVEMWELICPMVYLSRRIKPNTSGPGRHRGGSSFESLQMVWNTPFWELQNLGTTKLFSSQGIFGGYPGSVAYLHNIRDNDLAERAAAGEAYPVADGPFSDPALLAIEGERDLRHDNFTMLAPFKSGDLYHSVMKGAAGLGDPLERPAEAVERDVAEGHIEAEFATTVYAVADRDAVRERRLERARPAAEWWTEERARVLGGALIDPVKVQYAESMKLSPRWAAEFRGFWDLPEDFAFEIETPTLPADLANQPGKVTPEEAAARFLAESEVARVDSPLAAGKPLERETLAAMLDERLSRREVKAIQSGYKDPGRFDNWIAVLQDRVGWDDPIVLPLGEALNVVRRRADGELVIRSDAGHDFCRFDANWKMQAPVFVRDSDELLGEIYPKLAHCDPDWMELREFYCPLSGRLLEVEAVTRGYPVVHDFLPDVEGFYRGWLGREVP